MKNIVFLLVFMLFGFGILYFLLKSEEPATELQNALTGDDDKDGIINGMDQEKNTLWLSDTTSFKLRNFVAADGTLDRIKVDSLCNCFAVTDITERSKIKCIDNAEYFVFEGKLWHYDEATNSFIDNDNNKLKRGVNPTTTYYEKIVENSSSNVATVVNGNTTVEYNKVKYSVPNKLTSETGVVYNGADYRYFSGKWETRKNTGTGSWVEADDAYLTFILVKIGKKIDNSQHDTVSDEVSNYSDKKNMEAPENLPEPILYFGGKKDGERINKNTHDIKLKYGPEVDLKGIFTIYSWELTANETVLSGTGSSLNSTAMELLKLCSGKSITLSVRYWNHQDKTAKNISAQFKVY